MSEILRSLQRFVVSLTPEAYCRSCEEALSDVTRGYCQPCNDLHSLALPGGQA